VRRRRLLLVLIVAALAATMFVVARMKRDYVDFIVYQTAGQRALAAEPLYRAEDLHYQFKYLPAFALAMTPFAHVDPEIAKAIWFSLSVALLIAFVRESIAALPDRRRAVATIAWITALLIGKFVVKELVNGQTNVLFGWLLMSALLAAQRRHRLMAGALVGLAVFVKPYAIIVLPWLLFAHGLAAAAAAGVVIAIGLVLPAIVYGWSGNWQLLVAWYQTVTGTTPENLLFGENISFATMWAKWIGPGAAASALAVATGIAALGGVTLTAWWRDRVKAPDYLELAGLLVLIPVLSPQGWDYVLLLGTPAYVLLVDRWGELSAGWRAVVASAFALTSFTFFDLLGRSLYGRVLAWSLVTVGVIALLLALMHVRRKAIG
jgi:hypothetical protein